MRFALSRLSCLCHVESGTIFGEGTIPEPSTPHIGKGVALVAQAAAPVYPRVYRRSTISDSTNDHSYFYATTMDPLNLFFAPDRSKRNRTWKVCKFIPVKETRSVRV